MIITTFGTRGSIPVAGPDYLKYGGNTTCVRVDSSCLADGTWLVIDAGSGLMPLANRGVDAGVERVILLFTHYHHDHTQGLLLAPWTYMKGVDLQLYGPEENGIGPKQMLEQIMNPPFHPVSYHQVSSHMTFKGLKNPVEMVFVIHPEGGLKLSPISEIERAEQGNGLITFRRGVIHSLDECLVVRMYRSNHPERTICYRFEERPSGKVFVFLTDNENEDSTPLSFREHLKGADLLVMDSQYTRELYDHSRGGFGHGTPDFCVGVANIVGAKMLGLTHHDPASSDDAVDAIVTEAQRTADNLRYSGQVKACRDFDEFTL